MLPKVAVFHTYLLRLGLASRCESEKSDEDAARAPGVSDLAPGVVPTTRSDPSRACGCEIVPKVNESFELYIVHFPRLLRIQSKRGGSWIFTRPRDVKLNLH